MAKIDFEKLVSALNATQKGKEWQCKCPAHDDEHPSFYLSKDSKSGKILFKCFAGCSQEAILSALRDRDLWPKAPTKSARPYGVPDTYESAQFTQCWKYLDYESQRVCGLTAKYVAADGTSKKIIPFFRKTPAGRWKPGHISATNRPLYNACYASRANTIFVVEGEKCADAITNSTRKILGVTWPGGASAVSRCDWSILRECKDIRIWPDNDEPGKRAAAWIAAQFPQAKLIDLSQFGDQPAGWDCADWAKEPSDALALQLIDPPRIELVAPPKGEPDVPTTTHCPLNDYGNALRFHARFKDDLKFVPNIGWYFWSADHWQKDESGAVIIYASDIQDIIQKEANEEQDEKEAKQVRVFARQSGMLSRLRAMAEIASGMQGICTEPDALDADPFLFACKNGVVDLRTKELIPNRRELLLTKQSPIAYDAAATCPTWDKFLRRIMGDSAELIAFLQRAIGYSMTSDTSEQVMFMLWGSGQNGKSVFIETLAKIFGTYHTATTSDLVLLDQPTGENAIARLKGARFVPASEVPENGRFNEARIKQLTGQDTISARYLYKEYFDFRPHFKFWLRCNSRPQISGGDLGIWRRMHCIPFTQTILESEKDKHLAQKLEQELPGILNWAIDGAVKWQEIGLAPPEAVLETVEEYKEDMDTIAQWLSAACIIDPECRVLGASLYESYKAWCEMVGERPLSQRKLMIKIKDKGFKRVVYSGARYYKGLDVKSEMN